MAEGAEGKGKEPGPIMMKIEVQSSQSDQDEEKECMGEYPALAEGLSEEELPYRFINNIRK